MQWLKSFDPSAFSRLVTDDSVAARRITPTFDLMKPASASFLDSENSVNRASGVSPSSSGSALEATRTDKSDIMLQTTPTDPAALARRPGTAGPLAVATPTTRRLADASISRNTRRAYAGALRRLDAWRGTAPVDDASLAVYLGELFEAGRAPATAALAVAAVRFRAKLAGQPDPAGEATARVCWPATVARPPTGAGARTAGASNPTPRRNAGADSTP